LGEKNQWLIKKWTTELNRTLSKEEVQMAPHSY
jgi:hypothetical protein